MWNKVSLELFEIHFVIFGTFSLKNQNFPIYPRQTFPIYPKQAFPIYPREAWFTLSHSSAGYISKKH